MEGKIIILKIKNKIFIHDQKAVLDLPLRLTVCLVIGSMALMFILMYILNPCILPGKMIVTIEPITNIIPSGTNQATFTLKIRVTDRNGYPIKDANILINGLGDAEDNLTNSRGQSIIEITPYLTPGVNEGYLDIIIKSSCKETFSQNKMIKVVRSN